MSSLLVILIGTVLVNTFLLMSRDEALGGERESGSIATSMRIGVASLVTLTLAIVATLAIARALPGAPTDVFVFIFSLAVVSIALGLRPLTRHRMPRFRRSLASSPILIVSNCLALGAILQGPLASATAASVALEAFSLGIAFAFVLTLFVTLSNRITAREVPLAFRLAPVTLVSAGLFALALMGLTGLFRM